MEVRSFAGAITLGLVTAFGLFWGMQAMIGVSGELKEGGSRLTVDFVRLRKDRTPEMKKREPPKREKPEQPPPPPEMNMAQNMKPSDAVGNIIPIANTGLELAKATSLGHHALRRCWLRPRPPRSHRRIEPLGPVASALAGRQAIASPIHPLRDLDRRLVSGGRYPAMRE